MNINHKLFFLSAIIVFKSNALKGPMDVFTSPQYYRFQLLELFKLEARFVLRPGQHVNNMEENTNYRSLQCNFLGQILKILKVGRGCSNVGQPSTKCFEQTTLCRLSSLGSTFNPSRLTRSSHFLRTLSTFGN